MKKLIILLFIVINLNAEEASVMCQVSSKMALDYINRVKTYLDMNELPRRNDIVMAKKYSLLSLADCRDVLTDEIIIEIKKHVKDYSKMIEMLDSRSE